MKTRLPAQAERYRLINDELNRIRVYRYNFELEMMLAPDPIGRCPMIA